MSVFLPSTWPLPCISTNHACYVLWQSLLKTLEHIRRFRVHVLYVDHVTSRILKFSSYMAFQYFIMSVPDEGYYERTWWRLLWSYLMKVIDRTWWRLLIVPDEGYYDRTWWRLLWSYLMKVIDRTWWRLLIVPDEGYWSYLMKVILEKGRSH